jgi:hypothetical protein
VWVLHGLEDDVSGQGGIRVRNGHHQMAAARLGGLKILQMVIMENLKPAVGHPGVNHKACLL